MSRLVIPNTFAGIVKLFKQVNTKHAAQAAPKTLTPFLDEEEIVMADDLSAVNDAETANTAFETAGKEAEKQNKIRDKLFDPVWKEHEGSVQFLKKLYRKTPSKLGDWSVDVTVGGRIIYPPDFSNRKAKVILFIDKHLSFAPGTSPLEPFLAENGIDLVANKVDANDALTAHDLFVSKDNERETKRIERDSLLEPVINHLHGMGQYLMRHFTNNPKKASDWGFEVDDSPQADRVRDVVLNPGEVKTIHDAVLKSVLTVEGPSAATVFRGKTMEGTGVTINTGGTFIIQRGFGTFTIKNESNTQKTTFSFLENR